MCLERLHHQNPQMSGNEHRQASDLIPPFFAQGAHKPLEYWGWGEEMRLGTASAELSRSRPIENHSKQIQARRTNEQCTNFKKSSVPAEQCAELNNTNRGGSYTSIGAPASSLSSCCFNSASCSCCDWSIRCVATVWDIKAIALTRLDGLFRLSTASPSQEVDSE